MSVVLVKHHTSQQDFIMPLEFCKGTFGGGQRPQWFLQTKE